MMEYVPYFYIFKTPNEKFSIAWTVCFAVLATLWLGHKSKNHLRIFLVLIFITFGVFAAYSVKGISDYRTGIYTVTRWLEIPRTDLKFISESNILMPPNSAVLRLPGGLNYQVMLKVDQQLYSGLDYILNNTSAREIRPDIDEKIYSFYKSENFVDELCLRKIEFIYMNLDEVFWFGKAVDEDFLSIYRYLDKILGGPTLVTDNHYLWQIGCEFNNGG